ATLPSGLIEGNAAQLGNQAIGVLIALTLGAAGSFVCLKVAGAVCGRRLRPPGTLSPLRHRSPASHPEPAGTLFLEDGDLGVRAPPVGCGHALQPVGPDPG
ncbi:MAG: hypothetical protein P4L40_07350, partial [Terracidiphilus sp.]|nr:hypothetical protein [Terracidiphilus sp.]